LYHLLALYLVAAASPSKVCRAKGMKNAYAMRILQVFIILCLECKQGTFTVLFAVPATRMKSHETRPFNYESPWRQDDISSQL
jgi:hypothetical protein